MEEKILMKKKILRTRKIINLEPKKDIIKMIATKDQDNIPEIIKMITEKIKTEIITDNLLQDNRDKTKIEIELLKERETGKEDLMLSMSKREQKESNNKINHLLVEQNKIITETIKIKAVI